MEAARAVHDDEQYEFESERLQQEQVPNWDDDDDDLINHNLPASTSAPQVNLNFLSRTSRLNRKVILVG